MYISDEILFRLIAFYIQVEECCFFILLSTLFIGCYGGTRTHFLKLSFVIGWAGGTPA
jgi:hypothetical protein